MTQDSPYQRYKPLSADTKIRCLVVIVFTSSKDTTAVRDDVQNWQPSSPTARFMTIPLPDLAFEAASSAVRDDILVAAHHLALDPECTVLLGFGAAGRFVVDALLAGLVPCAGVLGLNIAVADPPGRITRTQAMIRLVQQQSADPAELGHFDNLLSKIQSQDIDLRSLLLMNKDENDIKAVLRAGNAYLAELVAIASDDRRRGA